MQRVDLKDIKIKRILLYYSELQRLKVDHETSMQIMEYQFGVSDKWIEELLRKYDIEEFKEVRLDYVEVDIITIDKFVSNIRSNARKSRREQLELFL